MDVRSFFGRRPRTVVKGRRKVYRKAGPARAVRSVPSRARKAISTIAQRVVNRNVETKHAYQTLFTNWQPQYGSMLPTSGQPQLYNALFDVTSGTTGDQLVGNIMRPTRIYNDLQILLNDRTTDVGGANSLLYDGWDITVHVWYGTARRYKVTGDVIANAPDLLTKMFDNMFSPGTQVGFTGKYTDQLNPVNREYFNLKHKSVRLFKGPGINNTADAVSSSLYTPSKTQATMRLSWTPPKTLHYNDLEGLPQDFAPFFVIGYVHNDTSQAANSATGAASVLTKPALLIQAGQHIYFKDA